MNYEPEIIICDRCHFSRVVTEYHPIAPCIRNTVRHFLQRIGLLG